MNKYSGLDRGTFLMDKTNLYSNALELLILGFDSRVGGIVGDFEHRNALYDHVGNRSVYLCYS